MLGLKFEPRAPDSRGCALHGEAVNAARGQAFLTHRETGTVGTFNDQYDKD